MTAEFSLSFVISCNHQLNNTFCKYRIQQPNNTQYVPSKCINFAVRSIVFNK